jgi:hypothetical protein
MVLWILFDFEGSATLWMVVGSTILNLLDIEEEKALDYDPNLSCLLRQIL